MAEAYERVMAARAKGRPTTMRFIENIFTDFTELHGDRRFGDDKAIVAGIARLGEMPVTVIGMEKGGGHQGEGVPELRFPPPGRLPQGPAPDEAGGEVPPPGGVLCGYLRRLLRHLRRGAGPGPGHCREPHGDDGPENPVISVLIGEGGSGGAIGLAVADEVWMLENAWYSVISPEGCASILWKDSGKMKEAAACLKLTADDLYSFGVIEQVISEHDGDFVPVYEELKEKLAKVLAKNSSLPIETLLDNRYNRFRRIGAREKSRRPDGNENQPWRAGAIPLSGAFFAKF